MRYQTEIKSTRGAISILVLVIGIVASVSLAALVMLTSIEYELTQRKKGREQALNIAEAGINYYRWHMVHDPTDYFDGTGEAGVYTHEMTDPAGGTMGTYELRITPPETGSMITTVTSTGITASAAPVKRTISARFGTPSLARFAFLHNSNVWFGHGMTIYGPVYSNGGIRQDGINTSTVQTTVQEYTCGIESGCDPSELKPGIWGQGGPVDLWQFPVNRIDFKSFVIDFNSMQKAANEGHGLYLGPSEKQGYHLIFHADGTFSVYVVKTTDYAKGWSYDYLCENLYQIILSEDLIGTYQVANNPIIFIEDEVWAEGTLNGQTTLVAARFPIDTYKKNIWIPNNLVYLDRSGNHRLGLIAQNDIAFTRDVPKDFEVDGALLAQSGRVLRHHYNYHGCKQGNPEMKNSLTIYGSVISNLIAYWNFSGGGSEEPTSGFVKRDLIYDAGLLNQPPPYFPSSGTVELISWNEVKNP